MLRHYLFNTHLLRSMVVSSRIHDIDTHWLKSLITWYMILVITEFRSGYENQLSSIKPDIREVFKNVVNLLISFLFWKIQFSSVQLSSVAQSCPTLCDPMNWSTPGLPVHHHLPEFTQTQTREPRGISRVTAGFSSYDGEFRMPLVLAQASPIFHSSCEGKLGIALEWLQGQ